MANYNLHRVLILTEGSEAEACDAIGEMLREKCSTLSGDANDIITTWQFMAPYTAQVITLPDDQPVIYDTDLEALPVYADTDKYREAWQAEVASGDTVRGLSEWIHAAIEEGREF